MKKLFALLAIIGFNEIYAQASVDTQNEVLASYTGQTSPLSNANTAQNLGGFNFYNPARDVDGSMHLYNKWENMGVIIGNDGKKYSIRNINLNIKKQAFESQYEGNKIFTFNFNNIDKFVINNKIYKNYYFNDDVNVCEILVDNPEFQLLKSFKLKFVEGSANPMLNRNLDRYVRKTYYYVKQGDEIKPIKLKKKKLLKLVDEERAKMIQDYANKNNLSFKKEADVKILLESVK